jgi:nitroreductase
MKKMLFGVLLVVGIGCLGANKIIKLPKPDMKGGKPLMQCLALRKSSRSFSEKMLSDQQLSNLLWAAWGINRSGGMRTAPSAHNNQDMMVYVAMKSGVYLYDAKQNVLRLVLAEDIRKKCGIQEFHAVAPVDLIFVSNLLKLRGGDVPMNNFYAATHVGYISQNVYLYCASEGLATVVCNWVDKKALAKILKLPATTKIQLTQPVGFPEK